MDGHDTRTAEAPHRGIAVLIPGLLRDDVPARMLSRRAA